MSVNCVYYSHELCLLLFWILQYFCFVRNLSFWFVWEGKPIVGCDGGVLLLTPAIGNDFSRRVNLALASWCYVSVPNQDGKRHCFCEVKDRGSHLKSNAKMREHEISWHCGLMDDKSCSHANMHTCWRLLLLIRGKIANLTNVKKTAEGETDCIYSKLNRGLSSTVPRKIFPGLLVPLGQCLLPPPKSFHPGQFQIFWWGKSKE